MNFLTVSLSTVHCGGNGTFCLTFMIKTECYIHTAGQNIALPTTRCIKTVVDIFIEAVIARSIIEININSTTLHQCKKTIRKSSNKFTQLWHRDVSNLPINYKHMQMQANTTHYHVQSIVHVCYFDPVRKECRVM